MRYFGFNAMKFVFSSIRADNIKAKKKIIEMIFSATHIFLNFDFNSFAPLEW
jgi:hypothetical protein